MKYKTTDREQRATNHIIVGFGYCEIQNIQRYINANAYTCGIYGWRADFYEFDSFTISTGYAPLTHYITQLNKKRGEFIKTQVLKLEKKLDNRFYNFQKIGNWDKGRAFIVKRINAIYQKAVDTIKE